MRNVPDRDDSFWQMVGDIVRETSPVMRCCFLTGLGIGVGAAIWFIVPMVSTKAVTAAYGLRGRRLDIAFGALIFLGCVVAGMVVGLVAGAVIETILEHLFGIKFEAPGTKKRKRRRY